MDFTIEGKYVLEQASQFRDLELIKKIVDRGVTPTDEAVIQASKYGHEELVNYYLDHPYWNQTDWF